MNINFGELKRLRNIKFPNCNTFLVKEVILMLIGVGISWGFFSASLVLYAVLSVIFTFICFLCILCKINDKIEGIVPTFFLTLIVSFGLFIIWYGQNYIITHPNEVLETVLVAIFTLVVISFIGVIIYAGFEDEINGCVRKVKNKIWRK